LTQRFIIIEKDFIPEHTFECGQCFRWNKTDNGNYIGIVSDSVLEVIKEHDKYFVYFENKEEDFIKEYFDLNRDYNMLINEILSMDDKLRDAVKYGFGIRILRQDIWECIISFIISINNNIPRIKKIIENISRYYGKEIYYKGRVFYSFPKPEVLAKASEKELRMLNCGFRVPYIINAAKMIESGDVDIYGLKNKSNEEVRKELMKLPGVGEKVSSCIMLYSLGRFDIFPVDVWIKRIMENIYLKRYESPREIEKFALARFKDKAGIVQQYLYFYFRNNKDFLKGISKSGC